MKKRILLIAFVLVLCAGILADRPASADDCMGPGGECPPPPACPYQPDPLTPGYWKNHPESWVACYTNYMDPLDELNICCESCYPCSCDECTVMPKAQVISIMNLPVATDKTYTMFDALVAAKLNRLAGADVSCINLQINQAARWMCEHPVGSGVAGSSEAWQDQGEALYEALDNYNNYGCSAPYP